MLDVVGSRSYEKASGEFVSSDSQADSPDQRDMQIDATLTPSEPQTPDKALPNHRPNSGPLAKKQSPEIKKKAAKKTKKGTWSLFLLNMNNHDL